MKVLFSQTDFFPRELLSIKKLEFEKTKPTLYSTFKTDITKVGLVFTISNLFINKISQGRNRFAEKNTLLALLAFSSLQLTAAKEASYKVY